MSGAMNKTRSTGVLRRIRRSDAFTLLEVMIAIGILTVGSVGILAMQQASTRGNLNARRMSTATAVTRTWIERIRRDSLNWRSNQTGAVAGTQYLQFTPAAGDSGWLGGVPADPNESYAFDWFGRDTRVASEMRYCVHFNTRWVVVNQVARVDVRTFWYKRGDGAAGDTDQDLFPNCGIGGTEAAVTAELTLPNTRLHAVHASTLVRWRQP